MRIMKKLVYLFTCLVLCCFVSCERSEPETIIGKWQCAHSYTKNESGKSSINRYFQNLEEALAEMFRVLKPGGQLLIKISVGVGTLWLI